MILFDKISEPSKNIFADDLPYLNKGELETSISLHLGIPSPATFPIRQFKSLINDDFRWNEAFQYCKCLGQDSLRIMIQEIMKFRGVSVDLDNILVTVCKR